MSTNASTLTIRPFDPDDLLALHRILSHPVVIRTTLQLPSLEITDVRERMLSCPPGMHRLVARLDSETVGVGTLSVDTNPRRAHVGEIGMAVHPDVHAQGIGTALLGGLLELADAWLGLRRVELDVMAINEAGIKLYSKHGFEHEGTLRQAVLVEGRLVDVYRMARLRGAVG